MNFIHIILLVLGFIISANAGAAELQSLTNLLQTGQGSLATGHYYEAATQLKQLEILALQQKDDYTATLAKGLQGYVALQQQNRQSAEQLLTEALTQAQQNNWQDLQVRFALYLGQLQDIYGNHQKARHFFDQALEQALQLNDKPLLVSVWYQLAKISLDEKQSKKVNEQLAHAETLLETLPTNSATAELWLNIGYQSLRLHQFEPQNAQYLKQAFENLHKALTQAQQFSLLRQQASAFKHLAQLYRKQNPPEAIKLLQSAINAAQKAEANDLLIDLEMQIGQLYQANHNDKQALIAYREAVKYIETTRVDIPISYEQGHSSFRETFAPIYLALANLLLQQTKTVNSTQQQVLLQEAQSTIELMKKSEMEDYFQSRCEIPFAPINLQKTDPHAVEIYPILLPDRLEIIVNTADNLYQFTQPVKAKEIEQLARSFSSQLRNPAGKVQEEKKQGQQLYEWLIKPMQALLEKKHIETLVYIPDGALRLVPLAALYDGKHFLIEDYAVVTSVGTSLVEHETNQHANKGMLLAGMSQPGDVITDLPETLLNSLVITATRSVNSDKRQLSRDLKLRAVELTPVENTAEKTREVRELLAKPAVVEQVKEALALPGVETEVKQLADQNAVPYLLNEDFSLDNFVRTAEGSPHKVLHIASHGFFGSTAEDSFIMTYDRILNMNKLETLLNADYFRKNPIDLITLSACQTAEGDDRSPLGISGIAIKSKVRSALGSLWSVADEATVELMTNFYQALNKSGISKAKALQQAEINLLKQQKFSNPVFWSPFILIGDWL